MGPSGPGKVQNGLQRIKTGRRTVVRVAHTTFLPPGGRRSKEQVQCRLPENCSKFTESTFFVAKCWVKAVISDLQMSTPGQSSRHYPAQSPGNMLRIYSAVRVDQYRF